MRVKPLFPVETAFIAVAVLADCDCIKRGRGLPILASRLECSAREMQG